MPHPAKNFCVAPVVNVLAMVLTFAAVAGAAPAPSTPPASMPPEAFSDAIRAWVATSRVTLVSVQPSKANAQQIDIVLKGSTPGVTKFIASMEAAALPMHVESLSLETMTDGIDDLKTAIVIMIEDRRPAAGKLSITACIRDVSMAFTAAPDVIWANSIRLEPAGSWQLTGKCRTEAAARELLDRLKENNRFAQTELDPLILDQESRLFTFKIRFIYRSATSAPAASTIPATAPR